MSTDQESIAPRAVGRGRRAIVHVSSFPPSPSGVSLYASVFDQVLERFGYVTRVAAPPDPRDAQSLAAALHGLRLGLGPRLRDTGVVHVELSGRALYQFYLALGLSVGRRRSLLVVTAHDAPTLVGWVLLFREVDRRPFRRVVDVASSTIGRRLELLLLSRCDVVLALTKEGADRVDVPGGRAVAIPHVVDLVAPATKEPRVFVPGYVSEPGTVALLCEQVARRAAVTGVPWRIALGSGDPKTLSEIQNRLSREARKVVELTGHQNERLLLAEFDRAFAVVRPVGTGQHNAFAASGPLAWAAARGCLILTNDSRSGARELAEAGLLTRSEALPEDLSRLLDRWPDQTGVRTRIARARSLLGVETVAQRYGAALHGADRRRSTGSAGRSD